MVQAEENLFTGFVSTYFEKFEMVIQWPKDSDKSTKINVKYFFLNYKVIYLTINPRPHPSTHIHQKMRKGCRNDYMEAFGAVYWAKKRCLKKSWRLQQLPYGGRGSTIFFFFFTSWCLWIYFPTTNWIPRPSFIVHKSRSH